MVKKVFTFLLLVVAITAVSLLIRLGLSGQDVPVVSPKRGLAVEAVYATGIVEPVYWAKLSAPMGGRMLSIIKDEGETVQTGDVIARLDDREERARIDQLNARLKMLASEMERQRVLKKKNVSSARDYERTISDYNETKAEIEAATKRVWDMVLVAPMDGQVLRKTVEAGEFVKSGDPIFWVGKPHPLQIVAEVDEEDIPKVRLDQIALIKSDAFVGKVIEGSVFKIIPKGDPINKIFLVEVGLPDNSGLLIGMTTEVNIVVDKHENALLLPVSAVMGNEVWVVEDGDAVRKTVKTGIVGDKTAEILEGLNEESLVINPFPENLKEGKSVDPERTEF